MARQPLGLRVALEFGHFIRFNGCLDAMRLPVVFSPGGRPDNSPTPAGFAIAIALSPNGTAEYLVLLKKHAIAYGESLWD
jgi:hypothetical protein